MACGSASFLKRALDAPVDVISLGGVISGNDPILDLEHLYHLVGDKDEVERIGPVMFASRWPIAVLSFWNRAKRLGSLTCVSLGPVGHQVPGGMLDPEATLPDGRTNLRQTLDYIESIVTDRFVAKNDLVKQPSNYQRYVAATRLPLNVESRRGPSYLPVAALGGATDSSAARRALRRSLVRSKTCPSGDMPVWSARRCACVGATIRTFASACARSCATSTSAPKRNRRVRTAD